MRPTSHHFLVALSLALVGCSDDPSGAAADAGAADVVEEADLTPGEPVEGVLAGGIELTELAVFQSVKVPVVSDGDVVRPEDRNAPIIAGRPTLVRAYVRPLEGWSSRRVICALELRASPGAAPRVLREERYFDRASNDALPTSVCSWEIPAAEVTQTLRIAARLYASPGARAPMGTAHPARAPRDGGDLALDARDDGGGVSVTLVPLRWMADGSRRLPDTSPAQIERMRQALLAMYPLSRATLEVRLPVDFNARLTATGQVDFGAVNVLLRTLRANDRAPSERYYYGLVQPTTSFESYCRNGCTLGQGYLVSDPDMGSMRSAAGVAYSGDRAGQTFVHELGHLHGRSHAPCRAMGADRNYPYPNGTNGVWGWDSRRRIMMPSGLFDFMGYCDPEWISDYHYRLLWDRVTELNGTSRERWSPPELALQPRVVDHRVLRWSSELAPTWEPGRVEAVEGESLTGLPVRWLDARGRAIGEGRAVVTEMADSDERHATVSMPPAGAVSAELSLAGTSARRFALPEAW